MKTAQFLSFVFLFILTGCGNSSDSPQVNYSEETVATPTLFAEGIISTETNSEFELTFSVDGLQAYFSRRAPEEKQKMYQTEFKAGTWTEPQVAPFSTDRDETGSITPNGEYFFFGSERPIPNRPNQGNFDMNIWMMKKQGTGWSDPQPLPAPINEVQIEGEEWPSSNNNFFFTNDNETFYYTTMRRGSTSIQLFRTTFDGETYSEPHVVEGLFEDDKFWVYSAVISPDGQFMVFNSYEAPGGTGGEDLFVSRKTENGWSRAKPIGSLVNTKNEESSPRFSRDGKYFFFSRAENLGNYEYGPWNIYFMETAYLNLDGLFQ